MAKAAPKKPKGNKTAPKRKSPRLAPKAPSRGEAPPKRAPKIAKPIAKPTVKQIAKPIRARSAGRSDDAHAFIPDPSEGGKPPTEDLAEILGEDFLRAATSGNDALEDDLDSTLTEERGGPFIETSAREELAHDVDESNPLDAKREAFPRANAGLVQPSPDELEEEEP